MVAGALAACGGEVDRERPPDLSGVAQEPVVRCTAQEPTVLVHDVGDSVTEIATTNASVWFSSAAGTVSRVRKDGVGVPDFPVGRALRLFGGARLHIVFGEAGYSPEISAVDPVALTWEPLWSGKGVVYDASVGQDHAHLLRPHSLERVRLDGSNTADFAVALPTMGLRLGDCDSELWWTESDSDGTYRLRRMPKHTLDVHTELHTDDPLSVVECSTTRVFVGVAYECNGEAIGCLLGIPRAGGAPTVLATGFYSPYRLVVDEPWVYVLDWDFLSSRVVAVHVETGETRVIASSILNPLDLVADQDCLYWGTRDHQVIAAPKLP